MNKVNLRDTNPNFYWSVMIVAAFFVAQGVNFLLTTPTFQQYDIPKNVIGGGFVAIGVFLFVALNLRRNLLAVRVLLCIGIAYVVFWAFGTTQTFFQGKSSLQLPLTYLAVAGFMLTLLWEPYYNPVTANGVKK